MDSVVACHAHRAKVLRVFKAETGIRPMMDLGRLVFSAYFAPAIAAFEMFVAHTLPLRRANVSKIDLARHLADDANQFLNLGIVRGFHGALLVKTFGEHRKELGQCART